MNVQTTPINDQRKTPYQSADKTHHKDMDLAPQAMPVHRPHIGCSEEEMQVFDFANEMKIPITFSDPALPDCPLVFANRAFENLTGHRASAMVGRHCKFLQGEDTDREESIKIQQSIEERRPSEAMLFNCKADGRLFQSLLVIRPIWFSRCRCFLLGCQHEFRFTARRREIVRTCYSRRENAEQKSMKLLDQEEKARTALVMQSDAVAARVRNYILRQKALL